MNAANTLKGFAVFALWTVTSFLCHYSGKLFLNSAMQPNTDYTNIINAIVLTACQTLMCYSLTDIKIRNDGIFLSMTICHFMATLSTNFSMALMFASSTFAIKLMEPITSACVQSLLLSVPLHPSMIISLPLIVGGAGMFTGNPLSDTSLSGGTAMAFLSNVILAVRNVVIKKDQHKNNQLSLRSFHVMACVIMCHLIVIPSIYLLQTRDILPSGVTYSIVCAMASSFLHVVYSYISTNIVLRFMSVLSHSVCNIVKRVLVVILLYSFGHRYASLYNLMGLAISSVGLLLYIGCKMYVNANQNIHSKENGTPNLNAKSDRRSKKFTAFLIGFICVGTLGAFYNMDIQLIRNTYSNLDVQPVLHSLAEFESRSFGGKSFQIMNTRDYEPDIDAGNFANKTQLKRFLKARLIQMGQDTDMLSPHLKTSTEVIREAQRIHFNLFKDLIGHFRYAMLFDVAAFENKGDPAISTGEIYLLRRLGIDLVYYCSYSYCKDKNMEYARNMSTLYTREELVILIHGGGNIVGYAFNDILRFKIFKLFEGFKLVVFSQSIFLKSMNGHFLKCKQLYCCNKNLTLVLRDRQSLGIAQTHFNNGTNLVMAPDMAFQIGRVQRYMAPMYDILWLKRKDGETPNYMIPNLPKDVSVKVRDWWGWPTPKGDTSLENAFLIATNGMMFLQRGRVVITDRLHGHVLCTLLNIPHVLIDNRFKKLSSYHRTWTKSVENTLITTNATEAVTLALQLLDKYKHVIPPIAPFMKIVEHPFEDMRGKPVSPIVPIVFDRKHIRVQKENPV